MDPRFFNIDLGQFAQGVGEAALGSLLADGAIAGAGLFVDRCLNAGKRRRRRMAQNVRERKIVCTIFTLYAGGSVRDVWKRFSCLRQCYHQTCVHLRISIVST